jgi:hypothetical protein
MTRILKMIVATGAAVGNDKSIIFMVLTAVVLLIASLCVPYYVDASGSPNNVYGSGSGSGKNCLGYSDTDCMTMRALPVITILLGFSVLMLMGVFSSVPFINKIGHILINLSISVVALLFLATVFSAATLGTQLGTPLNGSSLIDKAENPTNATTFKEGMALSATSTALFACVFLIKCGILEKMAKIL